MAKAGRPLWAEWPVVRDTKAWPVGGTFYHCHQQRFDGAEFNPTEYPQYRFSPIYDADGRVIPTWYAASAPEGAVAESLLHDIPANDPRAHLTAGQFAGRQVSAVGPTRVLRLVRLDHDGLRSLKMLARKVIETEADSYPQTSTIGQQLHDTTDADGLVWISRRRNIDHAVVLFGDRVTGDDLTGAEVVYDFDTLDGWQWLHGYVRPLGITVDPPLT